MLMNALETLRKPTVDGVCDDWYLEIKISYQSLD